MMFFFLESEGAAAPPPWSWAGGCPPSSLTCGDLRAAAGVGMLLISSSPHWGWHRSRGQALSLPAGLWAGEKGLVSMGLPAPRCAACPDARAPALPSAARAPGAPCPREQSEPAAEAPRRLRVVSQEHGASKAAALASTLHAYTLVCYVNVPQSWKPRWSPPGDTAEVFSDVPHTCSVHLLYLNVLFYRL